MRETKRSKTILLVDHSFYLLFDEYEDRLKNKSYYKDLGNII
jgi:hypothetical protein